MYLLRLKHSSAGLPLRVRLIHIVLMHKYLISLCSAFEPLTEVHHCSALNAVKQWKITFDFYPGLPYEAWLSNVTKQCLLSIHDLGHMKIVDDIWVSCMTCAASILTMCVIL